MTARFDADERRALVHQLADDQAPRCPRCQTPLTRREVPPRDEVSYVRDRIWLTCPDCGGVAVLDRREIERERSR